MSLRPLLAAGLGLAALLLQPLARADDAPVNCPLDVSAAAVLPGVPLAHLAGGRLLVGSAANSFAPWSDLRYRSVLAQQFAMLVPENEMKWKFIHPQQDRYDFRYADCLVHFAQQHGMKVMGGPLVWHFQQSPWLDTLDLDHDGYVALLRDHIRSVIGHFRERFPGVVTQWEVVNEPISNETCAKTLKCGLRSYFWSRKLGAEYINLAFKFAREADPQAQLLLNETGLESYSPRAAARRQVLLQLLDQLQADHVPLDAVGLQSHIAIAGDLLPSDELAPFYAEIARRNLDIAVTELDVKAPPSWAGGERPAAARQAGMYRDALRLCLEQPRCRTFIVWGFSDRSQWLHAQAAPLNEDYEPKPAWDALVDELTARQPAGAHR